MGAGAAAEGGRGPRGGHAHQHGVIRGHYEVLALGRSRERRTASTQESPALRDALVERRNV